MAFYTSWYVTATFALMLLLHVASAFLPSKWGSVLSKVNIGVHIAIVPLLLLAKISLEESVLLFLISLLVFLLLGMLAGRLLRREGEHRDL